VTRMSDQILIQGFQYGIYILEAVVCVLLFTRGGWRQLKGLFIYVTLLFGLDGLARPAVLNYFGRASVQFAYFYWLTDVALALGAFLLTCSFFRRACTREQKLWHLIRLLLFFIFILVAAISGLALTRHYTQLFTMFIVEFSQNLYFSCLVLNTLLYVMLQQLAIDDDELGMLVCGMGVQFAGEAAGLALFHLTVGENFARVLFGFLNPACTLGMLLIWVYAITKMPQAAPVRLQAGKDAALAEATAQ
jgi:hypothetical protein